MGDPLSVASGAVGIISLGLQVCTQLVSYCQACKDYGDDIQKLGTTAASLRVPLKQLRELIEETRLSDPETAGDLEEKAMHLEDSVRKLQNKLDTCKPVLDDFAGKVHTQMKKATHLFRKDMLCGMEKDLEAIQQTLQTALNINTFRKMNKLEAMQETALKLLNDLHVSINQIPARQLPPPALLQSLCFRQQENAQLISTAANIESQIERDRKATDVLWPANQSYAMTSRRTRQIYQRKHVKASFKYSSRLLNLFFSASLSISNGAGGISLAPVLNFQALCPEDSWQHKTMEGFTILHMLTSSISKADEILDDTIHQLQVAFMEGRASPSDMIQLRDGPHSLLDLLGNITESLENQSTALHISRFLNFLVACGSTTDNRAKNGLLGAMRRSYHWTDIDYPLVSQLLDLGGPLHIVPESMIEMKNMQYMIKKDEDGISCPSIIRVILRESAEDLRSALESRTIKSCDELNGLPLLDYAIGWPQGVKILLEFGANPKSTTLLFLRQGGYIPFIDSDEVNESTKILIDTGATFGIEDIHDWKTTRWNSLIIKSMAERRKKLWEWARCYLPPEEIIRFNKDEATIVDAQVGELHELLKSLGKHIPSCLQESRGWMASQTVYHALSRLGYDWTEIFDELYASGFRDIDAVDGYGRTPSMTYDSVINGAWFASKGADCGRRLPNSNGNVVILWSARIFGRLTTEFSKRCHLPSTELQRRKERMSRFRHFVQVFMLHASQDGCVCPCSPDGCTGLSAALRWLCQKVQAGFCAGLRDFKTIYPNFARHFNQPEFVELSDRSSFQQKLGALIEIFEALPKAGGIIVRAMTFEGLGINHACCTEVDPYFWMLYEAKGKSDDEVNEILDEEKTRHDELEKLVLEFDTKFTELGLPIWEFLTKHWQPRMIDYLSHRDPYDEEHHKETRKLGVDLEVDDSEIPHWIHFLGNQVEELDDEGS